MNYGMHAMNPMMGGMLGVGSAMDAAGDDPELYAQFQTDRNKQLIAQMLLARGQQQPQGQMVGRFYVPPSPLQHAGGLASMGLGLYGLNQADQGRTEAMKSLKDRRQQELATAISQMAKDFSPTKTVQAEAYGPGAPVATPVGQETADLINKDLVPVGSPLGQEFAKSASPLFEEGPRPTMPQEVPKSKEEIMAAKMKWLMESKPEWREAMKFQMQQEQAEAMKRLEGLLAQQQKDRDYQHAIGLKGVPSKDAQDELALKREQFRGVSGNTLANTADQVAVYDPVKGQIVANEPAIAAKERIAGAGASKTQLSVNSYTPASEEAQKKYMDEASKTRATLQTVPGMLQNIEAAKALIPKAKGFMGPGGETLLEATKFLNNRLGLSVRTEGIKNAEELRSRIFFNVMDNLKKMDAQPSQIQQQIMQDSLGKLGTDPNALSAMLDAYADTLKMKVSTYNEDVTGAMQRGVKFPYDPLIKLPSSPKPPSSAISDEDLLKKY